MVGLIGQQNHAAYVATKGAMISLTKAMAADYARYGFESMRFVLLEFGHRCLKSGAASNRTRQTSASISMIFICSDRALTGM